MISLGAIESLTQNDRREQRDLIVKNVIFLLLNYKNTELTLGLRSRELCKRLPTLTMIKIEDRKILFRDNTFNELISVIGNPLLPRYFLNNFGTYVKNKK